MTETRPVRVRFAPSPTGDLHIGGVRTALFNWLFAKHYGGSFILRIEDTDQSRTKEDSLSGILAGLKWAGLTWDEGPDIGGAYGPYVQSERLSLYQEWAEWLVANDKAYKSYESSDELELIRKATGGYDRRGRYLTETERAGYEAKGRKAVIRFKMPLDGKTIVNDLVRGAIATPREDMQDLILLKSDGFPTYHLANVVDDHFMGITHIIRGDEWIGTAPVHKELYDAFGWEMPQIAHAPVILKINGKGKMSKRDEGAAISYFVNGGYLPEAVINFLCNVGWNYNKRDAEGTEIQVFTKEDAAEIFDVTRLTTAGTKFDLEKLKWLNGEYIRLMAPEKLAAYLRPYLETAGYEVDPAVLIKIIPLVQERVKLLPEIVELAGFFFKTDVTPTDPAVLIPKKMDADGTLRALQAAHTAAASIEVWDRANMETTLRPLTDQLGISASQLFTAIRVATTGQTVAPPLFETLEVFGKDQTLKRIVAAIKLLGG